MMSPRRRTAAAVGILFLTQMATAIAGTSLIQAYVDGDPDRARMSLGVALMMCSGIAVVGIGLLMYPVLRTVGSATGPLGIRSSGSWSAPSRLPAGSISGLDRRSSRTTCCGSTSRPRPAG